MLSVFAILIVIIKVILSFSLLVMIHELGHFLVAKKSGVWVEEFGLGLPPRLFGRKIGETLYSLNALPIGGFVKLHGETAADEVVYPKRAFTHKKALTRIAITLAGIVMNFFLAIVCFTIIFWNVGIPGKKDWVITAVSANSPAQKAGLAKNDILESIAGIPITSDTGFKDAIQKWRGQEVALIVKRDANLVNLKVTPRVNPPAGEGALGIQFAEADETYFPPIWQRPFVGAWYGAKQTLSVSKAIIFGLGGIAQSVSKGQSPQGVAGPLAIIAIFDRIAQIDTLSLLNLIAVVSINLAIINLIPFPPLDGSRIALIIAEKLTRKKLSAKLEERVYFIGFAVLIGLMILITSHEIPALVKSGSLSKYADTLLKQK